MADIQSAAQWIGRLLVEEARYLYKIEGKVRELRDELEWMQCFLRDADANQYDNAMARRWVAQIREFAYEGEDIIEKFLVRVVPHNRGRSDLLGHFRKYSRILWEVGALHQIGSNIDSLKDKISALTSRLHTYGIKLRMGDSSSYWLSKFRDETYSKFKEHEIIGRDKEMRELVDRLKEDEVRVFAICGQGGIGKSFLADKIFQHQEIRRSFEAFAWAYVSQPCQISSVQQKLLSSLASKSSEQVAQMTDAELKDELNKSMLKRRSLVVLDGVWGKEVWDSLKDAFPIANKKFKSKLLLTTREEKIAEHVHREVEIYTLECLDKYQSKKLLETKVQGVLVEKAGEKGADGTGRKGTQRLSIKTLSWLKRGKDREANKLKDEMLGHCGGLPLAIVVLGGVLSAKRTLEEWKEVHKNINSYLIDPEVDQPWKSIFELSYYDIPYQLKTGFLYLGYFPTNLEIPTRKITQLWEAEGLVSSVEDEMSDDTVQQIAEACLGELVERSLVQVGSRGLLGKAKTCRLHDLMRDLCISKASKANWLNIVQLGVADDQPSDISSSSKPSKSSSKSSKSSRTVKRRFRRLAIYCSKTLEKLPTDYRLARYIRSLLFFNTLKSDDVLIPLKKEALKKAFNDFKLLRVLDIENIEVQSLPYEVGYLIHLRYLSLRGSWVTKLPSTIRYLRCLQTLDLRVLSFVKLRIPDVLWRMDRLVHLYLPSKSFDLRHEATKLQLRGLVHLETLVNFNNTCQEKDVHKLISLRKFSSSEFLSGKETIDSLSSASSTLKHIEQMSLRLDGKILELEPQKLAKCNHLHKLWLKGHTAELNPPPSLVTPYLVLPDNLVQLSFCCSKFQYDPMPVLEKLNKLKRLSLEEASYEGATMTCSKGGFRQLRYLTLKGLIELKHWEVERGAMGELVRLEISRCQKLNTIPEGLMYLKNLKQLTISFMPMSFFQNWVPVNSFEGWGDYWKVKHVPSINVSHVLDDQLTQ